MYEEKLVCIKNFKYMQILANLLKLILNRSAYQTPWNGETVCKKRRAAVVYVFIHNGQKYPLITFDNLPFILI